MSRYIISFLFVSFFTLQTYAQQSSPWIILRQHSVSEQHAHKLSIEVVQIEKGKETSTLSRLKSQDEVLWVEKDQQVQALLLPNDPGFEQQWYLQNLEMSRNPQPADIRANLAWEIGTGKKDVVVGILDSGIDWQHPDLAQNIWQNLAEDADQDGRVLEWNGSQWIFDPGDQNGIDDDNNGYIDDFIGWDFVNNDNNPMDDHIFGHGTHVGGIIGANGDNGIGVSGIAWEVQLMALKFLDSKGTGFISQATEAMNYALQNGAVLTNHSWGSPAFSQVFHQMVLQAKQQGHLIVTAAGNNYGNDNDLAPLYPSSYSEDNVIAVGASNLNDSLTAFTNVGLNSVDLFAPGLGIYSCLPNDQYGYLSGTSMAAPMVSGALALYYSHQPNPSYKQAKERLLRSVSPIPALRQKCLSGGRLDVFEFLNKPILFLREENWAILDAAEGLDGKWIELGQSDSSHLLVFRSRTGEIQQVKNLGRSPFSQLVSTKRGDLFMAGKSNIQGNAHLALLDEMGAPKWSKSLGLGMDFVPNGLRGSGGKLLIYGQLGNGQGLVVQLDSMGNVVWARIYSLPNAQLRLVDLQERMEGGYGLLGNVNDDQFFVSELRENGILEQSSIFSPTTNSKLQALSLHPQSEEDELTILFEEKLANGHRSIQSIEWEADDNEIESGWKLDLGQTAQGPMLAQGFSNGLSLLSVSRSINGTPSNYFAVIQGESLLGQESFDWNGNLQPKAVVWNQGVGLFATDSATDRSIFLRSDIQARALCQKLGASINLESANSLSSQSLSLHSSNLNPSSQNLTLNPSTAVLSENILCDNSNCDTRAFFTLPSLLQCPSAEVLFDNQSENAQSYTWYQDGVPFSTDSLPLVVLPDEEGAYRISLHAENGSCLDTFGVNIQINELPNIQEFDTIHCGPGLRLRLGQESPILMYRWTDEQGDTLSHTNAIRIDSTGTYELTVENTCGENVQVEIGVELQQGCVWPGDANADGEVDMDDYLLMGTLHGATGIARPNASTDYRSQLASDWSQSLPMGHPLAPGLNYKHADADGDGIIDVVKDGDVIRKNFTRPSKGFFSDTSQVELSLEFEKNRINLGDSVRFNISLNQKQGRPIQQLYGIALSLSYNTPLSQGIKIETSNSIFKGIGAVDTLLRSDPGKRRLDIGLTRFDERGVDGTGLAMFGGITILIDDIGMASSFSGSAFFTMSITDAKIIRPDGSLIPINGLSLLGNQTLEVVTSQGSPSDLENELSGPALWKIGPNPSNGFVFLYAPLERSSLEPLRLELINMQGQVVWNEILTPVRSDEPIKLQFPLLPSSYFWLKLVQGKNIQVIPIKIFSE